MAFADKYRDKVARTKKSVVDKRIKNESELDKIRLEEEERRKLWEKRRSEIKKSEEAREKELLNAWGVVVMASGFADEFAENFELLTGIIHCAMKEIKENPDAMNRYLELMKTPAKE